MHLLSKNNYFSILLALIPISFIAGNLVINLIVILLIFSTIFFYKTSPLQVKFYFLDKLLFIFFALVILTGFINDYELQYIKNYEWYGFFPSLIKSLLFLKYLLLYICLRFLIEKEIISLKFFFISCFLCVIFVSLDLFYQFINGKDIFGYQLVGVRKLSGPFGDELIAGGYLQRFSLFAFFTIPLFFKNFPKKYSLLINLLLFLIILSGIILSGNRFPLILFLLLIFLVVFFEKQNRKYFLKVVISFLIIFVLLFNLSTNVKKNFKTFYYEFNKIRVTLVKGDMDKPFAPTYLKEFYSFYNTWLLNKYIGGGIKNFRLYCHFRKDSSVHKCNMHPHNYYLEILTETGLIGFVNITIMFILLLYISFYKKYFTKSSLQKNSIIIPFMFLFMTEIFPFRSSGSFFTTGTAVYLFFLIGILVGLIRKNESIEKSK